MFAWVTSKLVFQLTAAPHPMRTRNMVPTWSVTISISKYDLKSDTDIDEIDIDIDLDWYFCKPSQQPALWPGLANFRATRSRREAYSEIQETRFTLKARQNVEIDPSLLLILLIEPHISYIFTWPESTMQLLHKNCLVTYFTHFSLLACIASSIRGHQIYQVSLFRMNVFSLRTRLSPFITNFLVIFSSQVNGSLSSSFAKLGPTEPLKLARGCDREIYTDTWKL